jgi:hypothetical protein
MGFLGSFFGSDQRKDINRANKKATAALDKGEGQITDQYGQAIDTLEPYEDGGQRGFNAYLDAMGLNGEDARRAVQESYFNDPAMIAENDLMGNALMRKFNAQGQVGGGGVRMAMARSLQENYGNHLQRLAGVGNTGANMAGAQSGLKQGLGDSYMNLAATRAGQSINHGNALAASRNIGMNNITGLVGAGAKAVGAYGSLK